MKKAVAVIMIAAAFLVGTTFATINTELIHAAALNGGVNDPPDSNG